MTGVEGYVESAGSGLVAGVNAYLRAKGEEDIIFPKATALGSMAYYITHASAKHFQPMNANYSLIPKLPEKIRQKRERNMAVSMKALDTLAEFKENNAVLKV